VKIQIMHVIGVRVDDATVCRAGKRSYSHVGSCCQSR